jgi:hypothetical protein
MDDRQRMTLGRHYTLGLVVLLAVLGFVGAMIVNGLRAPY